MPLLAVENLHVTFARDTVEAVRGLDIRIDRGQIHGLVGESGSGKSVTARTILGIEADPTARATADRMEFDGVNLLALRESELRTLRGKRIAMIFQEPGKYLNPALTIGRQITEVLLAHTDMTVARSRQRALELLAMVELPRPEALLQSYPHELSGGMKQRALIAMAIACGPSLLLADEPTTALDVTVQRQILLLLTRLARDLDMAVLFISHDLAVVQAVAEWVSVIYAGKILESAPAKELFANPIHPYTKALFDAIPTAQRRGRPLAAIPGQVPDAGHSPAGCPFHPRCPLAEPVCRTTIPQTIEFGADHLAACHVAARRENHG